MTYPRDRALFSSSRPGYTWLGMLITFGAVPWALLVILQRDSVPDGLPTIALVAVAPLPAAIWVVMKFRGPRMRPDWWYRAPGALAFAEDGVHWRTTLGLPMRPAPAVVIPWSDFDRVAPTNLIVPALWGPGGTIRATVPTDLRFVCQPRGTAEFTFAQALVASRPEGWVLESSALAGRPISARPRRRGEPASTVITQPLAQARNNVRVVVIFALILFVLSVIRALVNSASG